MNIAAAILICLAALNADETPSPQIIIRDASVFDSITGKMVPNQTIIIEGQTITAVDRSSEEVRLNSDAVEIDGSGKYIVPGLVDMHVHAVFVLDGAGIRGEEALPFYLKCGVTSIRTMGDALEPVKALAECAKAEPAKYPQLFLGSPFVDADPPFHKGPVSQGIKDPAAVPAFVQEMADAGVTTMKLYMGVNPEVGRAVIEEAHKRDMTVAGHMVAYPMDQAAQDGIDTVEHVIPWPDKPIGADAAPYADILKAMAEHKAFWTPTLVMMKAMVEGQQFGLADDPAAAQVPENLRSLSSGLLMSFIPAAQRDQLTGVFDTYLQCVKKANDMGIPMLTGTDGAMTLPGISLHQELELLVQAGLTPAAALQAATINPARALKQEQTLGSIEPGKQADLVILDANPLDDIKNTRKINTVIHQGQRCQS